MYQQGRTAGICVYDDGTFALFGYVTLVWGKYAIQNEKISFVPNVPKQAFSVLGRENKNISNGMIITVGSEFRRSGPIQIQFDSAKVLNLFDENFPKDASHYTTKTIDKARTLTLSQNSENTSLNTTTVYFNDQFKSATGFNYLTEKQSTFDVQNYVLDKGSNKLIHKEIYKKGKDYSKAVAQDYHDERYMLSYQEIPIANATKTESGKVQVAPWALFTNAQ